MALLNFILPHLPLTTLSRWRQNENVLSRCRHQLNALSKTSRLSLFPDQFAHLEIVIHASQEAEMLTSVPHTPPHVRTSTGVTTASSHDHLDGLRRHKLALLLIDLVCRITAEFPPPLPTTLPPLLSGADRLANLLHPHPSVPGVTHVSRKLTEQPDDDAPLRQSARTLLWHIRDVLDPLSPSPSLRASLEMARSACLHIQPPASQVDSVLSVTIDSASRQAVLLEADIALLQELNTLRRMERLLNSVITDHHPKASQFALRKAAKAAAALGIDDYRVRGKTRLADAVIALVAGLEECDGSVHSSVTELSSRLNDALMMSLQTDLIAKRPAGRAMLLRPRIFDIPNFDRVNDTFLRGGQPTSEGLQWLYDYGVTLVIDLRGSDRQNQWHTPSCRLVEITSAGRRFTDNEVRPQNGVDDGQMRSGVELMQICNIPIEDFGTPNRNQLSEFIALVNCVREKGGVVFVHCKAGIGRTGTLVACWRISQGASVEDAIAKESLYSDGGGGLRQETFVREFAASWGQRE